MSGQTGTHTAPLDGNQPEPGQLTLRRFLVEWLLLSAAIAAPYVVFGDKIGIYGVAAIFAIYVSLPNPASREKAVIEQHANTLRNSGGLATFALLPVVPVIWVFFVFDLRPFWPTEWDPLALLMFGLLIVLAQLFIAAIGYLLSLRRLRRTGAVSGGLWELFLGDFAGLSRSPLLVWGVGAGVTLGSILSLIASIVALQRMAASLTRTDDPALMEIINLAPTLPMGLLATSALCVLSMGPTQRATRVRTQLEGGIGLPRWQGLLASCAIAVSVTAYVYPIHFGLVAALSSVAGIEHLTTTTKALPNWVADKRNAGLFASQIAANLNKHGHWQRDEPNAGLTALMPELGTKLNELAGGCKMSIEAGTMDSATLSGVSWMPAKAARAEIKYCMRIACPSPVRWNAPPSVLLYSSHPSRKKYWLTSPKATGSLYIDIHANGVAAAPGGYCTADGRLAKDFQG